MSDTTDTQYGDQAFRNKEPHGRWPEMTYGGALSFLRRRYSRDLNGVDVAVSGVPFDNAVTNRPGARLGPRAIRAASVQLAELKSFPFGFDPFDTLSVVDYGDCFVDPHEPSTVISSITDHISGILDKDVFPLSFGGDHFVTYPILRAIAEKHGPVSLLHFDAHCDTWDDDGTRFDHGSMFLRAKREGLISVETSCQVGIRTANDTDHGFEILTAPWVHRNGPEACIDAIRERVGNTKTYLTFDIDCLDPAFAPGTGTPVPGGLSSAQALTIIRALGDLNLVGADVVEVSPAYDVSEVTALSAASIAHDILCLLALRKGAKPVPIGKL
ncbi:agmatinase [Kordiimonas sediminis]|uniref:Agmatinase n=1 Tax=Kordiimonas sediminis TaxID=1735581 RepID=A0A919E6Y2_9PROT|nr:agmatinase [Kordiimonas sediminis]GHF19324.1 agmatinase [Kordiimonas sediminis]